MYKNSLPELLGNYEWGKLKLRPRSGNLVKVYEALAYQPMFPREIRGTDADFMTGYLQWYQGPDHSAVIADC